LAQRKAASKSGSHRLLRGPQNGSRNRWHLCTITTTTTADAKYYGESTITTATFDFYLTGQHFTELFQIGVGTQR